MGCEARPPSKLEGVGGSPHRCVCWLELAFGLGLGFGFGFGFGLGLDLGSLTWARRVAAIWRSSSLAWQIGGPHSSA